MSEFSVEFSTRKEGDAEKELLIYTVLAMIATILFNGGFTTLITIFSIVYSIIVISVGLWALMILAFPRKSGIRMAKNTFGELDTKVWDEYLNIYWKRFTARSYIYGKILFACFISLFVIHGAHFLLWITLANSVLMEVALLRLYQSIKKHKNAWKVGACIAEFSNFIDEELSKRDTR